MLGLKNVLSVSLSRGCEAGAEIVEGVTSSSISSFEHVFKIAISMSPCTRLQGHHTVRVFPKNHPINDKYDAKLGFLLGTLESVSPSFT